MNMIFGLQFPHVPMGAIVTSFYLEGLSLELQELISVRYLAECLVYIVTMFDFIIYLVCNFFNVICQHNQTCDVFQ